MAKLLKAAATQSRQWEEVFEEFLLLKKAEGASPRTLYDYTRTG